MLYEAVEGLKIIPHKTAYNTAHHTTTHQHNNTPHSSPLNPHLPRCSVDVRDMCVVDTLAFNNYVGRGRSARVHHARGGVCTEPDQKLFPRLYLILHNKLKCSEHFLLHANLTDLRRTENE